MGEFRVNKKDIPVVSKTENGKSIYKMSRIMVATWFPITNYFRVPNDIFNLELCAGEIAVYSFLMRMENRVNYTCYPSYKVIGNALKMSKNTVAKYVKSLEDKGLIETEQTKVITAKGEKRNGTLMYRITPIKDAVQEYYRRQLANCGIKR